MDGWIFFRYFSRTLGHEAGREWARASRWIWPGFLHFHPPAPANMLISILTRNIFRNIVGIYWQVLFPGLSSFSSQKSGGWVWNTWQGWWWGEQIFSQFVSYSDFFSGFLNLSQNISSNCEDVDGTQGWSGQAGGNCWHLLPLKSNFHPIASILNFLMQSGKRQAKFSLNVILTFLNADFQIKQKKLAESKFSIAHCFKINFYQLAPLSTLYL